MVSMIRVLVVEDDANLSLMIKLRLEKLGHYRVERASDGELGLRALANFRPDIVITDLEMRNMDGNAMVEELRRRKSDIPVIVLTGRADLLRHTGANAYLTKPFDVLQLDLNIKALLKIGADGTPGITYRIGRYTFDTARRTLILNGDGEVSEQLVQPTASKILEMLCREMGSCVERKKILGTIWGDAENEYISHNLDVQIDKIRRALKGDPSVSIETIRKTGIILKVF